MWILHLLRRRRALAKSEELPQEPPLEVKVNPSLPEPKVEVEAEATTTSSDFDPLDIPKSEP